MDTQDNRNIEHKDDALTEAEKALKELKVNAEIKLGPIPFIAAGSVKGPGIR